MKNVCLVAIVKNEAAVIRSMLDSARPFITSWSICDTGSTDGTQGIILEHLKGIPGTLHQRPWVDQQHNRNESIELAEGNADYLLMLDADEVLECAEGFKLPDPLTAYAYGITVRMWDTEFQHLKLVQAGLRWRWIGRRHPYLKADREVVPVTLAGVEVTTPVRGSSNHDPDKYAKHAAELEQDCLETPGSPRLRYYLAQSYRDAGMHEKALENYQRRMTMEGWHEERWSAAYEAAKCLERLGRPMPQVVAAYLAAVELNESRAEPLYCAARYLRWQGRPDMALAFAREAAAIPRPATGLFLEASVYAWRALDELVLCAYFAGELQDAQDAIVKLRMVAEDSDAARITRNAAAIDRLMGSPK